MITPHPIPNPGGKEIVLDGTEYQLNLGSAFAVPEVYMPDAFFNRKRVFYQRQEPSCGANGGAFMAAYLDEDPKQEYSPDFQWVDIKSFDGYALSDGTDMRSIFKSIKKGSLPYAMLPEETTLPLAQYSSKDRITPAMLAEAPKHQIEAYGFHTGALTFSDLKNLIYTHKAVALLVRIGDEFWTDKKGKSSWAEKDILPLRTPKSVVSGHFIVAGAFDKDNIYFANWWSKDWGRKGYGYFQENYLPQVGGVGTIVDSISKVTIPKFTKDLYIGVTDPQVTELQRYLNNQGYPVATPSLPGSAGHETAYFGPATQKALIAFQKGSGISPASGYCGSITRTYINAKI